MKKEISPAAIAGVVAVVVVVAAAGLFLGLRDPAPTKEIRRDAAAKQGPPPEDKPMPAWAVEKLRGAEGAH